MSRGSIDIIDGGGRGNSGGKQQNMDNESMIDVWMPAPISWGHAMISGVSVMRHIVAKYIIMIHYHR